MRARFDRVAVVSAALLFHLNSTAAAQTPAAGTDAQPPTCTASGAGVRCQSTVSVTGAALPALIRSPLDTPMLDAEQLRVFGPDTATWIRMAQLAAGSPFGQPRMNVDGLSAGAPVPPSWIRGVSVNADRFSVEHAAVDQVDLDVEVGSPDRAWRWNLVPPVLAVPGHRLVKGDVGRTRGAGGGVGGPVARLPLTWRIDAGMASTDSRPALLNRDLDHLIAGETAEHTRLSHESAEVALTGKRLLLKVGLHDSVTDVDHGGYAAQLSSDSTYALRSRLNEIRTTWQVESRAIRQSGGLVWQRETMRTTNGATSALLAIGDQMLAGGSEFSLDESSQRRWAAKHVFESTSGPHPWKAGADLLVSGLDVDRRANPYGRIQTAGPAMNAGTTFQTLINGPVHARTTAGALFAEAVVVNRTSMAVRSGVRVDWDSRDGAVVSPRLTAGFKIAGIHLLGAGGLMVGSISPSVYADLALRDGIHGRTLIVRGADMSAISLTATLDPAFTRRRDVVLSGTASRPSRVGELAGEYTWTRGRSLSGATREWVAGTLVDAVKSDRSLSRQQARIRLQRRARRGTVVINYTYNRAFDDSAGLFALPERQDDPGGEWARSSGFARHQASIVSVASLPWRLRTGLTMTARSGAPFNITSGLDVGGRFTYTDRAGRARNSGTTPGAVTISAALQRPVAWRRLHADAGLRIDNLFDRTNVTSFGHVAAAPLFRQALDAAPGRSITVWMTFSR